MGRRQARGTSTIATELRVNERIRIREVRVIDEAGQQLGVMPTAQAQAMARERGLDLVEVAPTAQPPVCRILDYGQYRYETAKRERDARKARKSREVKEIRFGVKIGAHDFQTKLRRAAGFLAGGDRVKLTVRFRGREITHPQLARDLLDRAAATLAELATVEKPALLEGRNMSLLLGPGGKEPGNSAAPAR